MCPLLYPRRFAAPSTEKCKRFRVDSKEHQQPAIVAKAEPRNNPITGTIPTSISNLQSLADLTVTSCQITGTMPVNFETWHLAGYIGIDPHFRVHSYEHRRSAVINASANTGKLNNGTIPESIGQLEALTKMTFSEKHISGSIPSTLAIYSHWNN